MGNDAVADLRAWQREQASAQDRALRAARRAQGRIVDIEAKGAEARVAFGRSVDDLEATGLSREQCAAFLGLSPQDLVRLGAVRRRWSSGDATGSTARSSDV